MATFVLVELVMLVVLDLWFEESCGVITNAVNSYEFWDTVYPGVLHHNVLSSWIFLQGSKGKSLYLYCLLQITGENLDEKDKDVFFSRMKVAALKYMNYTSEEVNWQCLSIPTTS